MKALFWIIFFIFFGSLWSEAQVYFVDEHFNSAPSVPAGFTGGGGAFGSGTAVSNYGRNSPSIQFKVNNQTLTYGPWSGAADQISFFHRALTGSGSSFVIQESTDGSTWSDAGSVTAITTGATYTGSLLATSRYVRLVFTLVSSNHVYVDDLRIRSAANNCDDPITILELLINGGCGSCEGSEEFLYFETGGLPLNIGYLELVSQTVSAGGCAYGGNGFGDNLNTNWVQSGSYTALQDTYISNLNAWAACPGVFVPVPSDNIIPANSRVLAFTGATPTAPYNFGAICSVGTIYVIFADQQDCAGKYSNASCNANCDRYVTLFNHETGCVDNQHYMANSVATTVGNAYIFVPPAIGYTSTANCASLVLDIELKRFDVLCENGETIVLGEVFKDDVHDQVSIEQSFDGINFTEWCRPEMPDGSGFYSFECVGSNGSERPAYYRLRMDNASGIVKYSHLIFEACRNDQQGFSAFFSGEKLMLISNQEILNKTLTCYSQTGQVVFSHTINAREGETLSLDVNSIAFGIYTLMLDDAISPAFKLIRN